MHRSCCFPNRIVLCILLMLTGVTANAVQISYYLDQTNAEPHLTDGVNYLQVTISDSAFGLDANAIRFDVQILAALTGIAGTHFGIQSFGFNTRDQANAATTGNVAGLPSGWTVSLNNNLDGFGKFELIESGDGSSRVSPLLTFYVTNVAGDSPDDYAVLSTGNAGQGNVFFGTHVAGFLDQDPGAGDVTSAFFGGSTAIIPVPAAAWLFGSALAVVGGLRRRR